jgi:hypothetical protein
MASLGRRVDVGTTPTLLISTPSDSVAGQRVIIKPVGGAIDIGGDDVEAGAGFEVADGGVFADTLSAGDAPYGVVAAGTVTVHVYESGV